MLRIPAHTPRCMGETIQGVMVGRQAPGVTDAQIKEVDGSVRRNANAPHPGVELHGVPHAHQPGLLNLSTFAGRKEALRGSKVEVRAQPGSSGLGT